MTSYRYQERAGKHGYEIALVKVLRRADSQDKAKNAQNRPISRENPYKPPLEVLDKPGRFADVFAVDVEDDEATQHKEEVHTRMSESEKAIERHFAKIL